MARGLVCNIVPGACSSGHELVIVARGLVCNKVPGACSSGHELVIVARGLVCNIRSARGLKY